MVQLRKLILTYLDVMGIIARIDCVILIEFDAL